MLTFPSYRHIIDTTSYTTSATYQPAFLWLHPYQLPVGVVSIAPEERVVKIPAHHTNSRGYTVPVIAISANAFSNHPDLTDIILPSSIGRLPAGAFAGCTGLKRITIPKNITRIPEGTFAGCDSLEDVYYEGSIKDWAAIEIVHRRHEVDFGDLIPGSPVERVTAERLVYVPGNEALFAANIHFNCDLAESEIEVKPVPVLTKITVAGNDATDFFRRI